MEEPKTTLYCYLGDHLGGHTISVCGRTPKNNRGRNDTRYWALLEREGLTLEDVQTYMLVEYGGKDILFLYTFCKERGTWSLAANCGKTSITLDPLTYEETLKETVNIYKRLIVDFC
jgi:hypothetical protein